jgi:hypothetical protein
MDGIQEIERRGPAIHDDMTNAWSSIRLNPKTELKRKIPTGIRDAFSAQRRSSGKGFGRRLRQERKQFLQDTD